MASTDTVRVPLAICSTIDYEKDEIKLVIENVPVPME